MRAWQGVVAGIGLVLTSAAVFAAPAGGSYGAPVFLGSVKDKRLTESSGLVASRRTPGVFWTHNDSGDGPFLFAIDRQARVLARFEVTGAKNVDWEDIAAGPGTGDEAVLWVGDIGDNGRNRTDTAVYRVPEPSLAGATAERDGRTMMAQRYPFRYPDGHHDAETLLVHPKTGEVFIVTKEPSGVSGVYRFPMPLTRDRTVTLEKVARITFTNPMSYRGMPVGKLATGGDISPDGTRVAVRTYADGYEWRIPAGATLAKALAGKPLHIDVPWLGQYEALCYNREGTALLTTSEGSPCPVWEMTWKSSSRPAK